MPSEIIRGDITEISADAIVDTANPNPVIGSGVDAGMHKKAGPKLLEARKKVGPIAAGQAAVTPAFNLDAKFVIHAVGPVWEDGAHGEETNNLMAPMAASMAAEVPASLDDMLQMTDAGFSETLLKLIDRTGKKDAEI